MSANHDLPRLHVKRLKDIHGGYKTFYEVLYEKPPETHNELQRFINYVNRGNYNLDFLVLLVAKAGLKGMTLEEFLFGATE
ncbi:hypothetical protein [Alteromonas sp. a30]|uniref:hypothetical protein n=1 Tax=Alteromonas sp. a30 TaxID=2730917 RepID=UPI002280CF62|nr:hypothetical protein [Alteromonas sp. a30]MCY7297466.1 hypothetical protein [Alteromonas sp. a30]